MHNEKISQRELGYYEELFAKYKYYPSMIVSRKAELSIRFHDENVGGGRSSDVGNPTESLVFRELGDFRLQWLIRLKKAVEDTINHFSKDIQNVIKTRFFDDEGINDWETTAQLCCYSRSQIYRIRFHILEVFANYLGVQDNLGFGLC